MRLTWVAFELDGTWSRTLPQAQAIEVARQMASQNRPPKVIVRSVGGTAEQQFDYPLPDEGKDSNQEGGSDRSKPSSPGDDEEPRNDAPGHEPTSDDIEPKK